MKIEWHPVALKEFATLDQSVQKRIHSVLQDAEGVIARLQRLSGDLSKLHKLRVGDYRLIGKVDRENELLTVLLVSHRSQSYDRLRKESLLRRVQDDQGPS